MQSRPFIIPIFIPHIGCPHRCVFCDQESITGHEDGMVPPESLRKKVVEFLGHKDARRGSVEVAFYGGNFLGLPKKYRTALLEEAQTLIRDGKANGIRFSTRPDPAFLSHMKDLNTK